MKKILFVFVFLFINNCYSQELPYYFEDALKYSIKYEFYGNNYIIKQYNNSDYSYGAVSYLQSKYDNAFRMVQEEIFKLKGLILINRKNREYIYQTIILN
jgi:hypothetical protein